MAKIYLPFLALVLIQFTASGEISFRWCARSTEKTKCNDFMKYANETAQKMNMPLAVGCVDGSDSDDCVNKIKNNAADFVTLDGGRVYSAGKDSNLIPFVSEEYGAYGVKYYAVAVVKQSTTNIDINSLKGKKSCHTGARRTAGWRVPIGYLLRTELLPAVACGNDNNDFISAANFFSQSCVPGVKKYNTSGDIPGNLCALCEGTGADKCSSNAKENKYVGYHGSFMCMADGKGEVAFAKHTTTEEVVSQGGYGSVTDYQYLCRDGTRKAIGQHEKCHLGFNPAHAVVTRKDHPNIDNVIKILKAMSKEYGVKQTNSSGFQLFNSTKYGNDSYNLMFKDSTTALVKISKEKRTYEGFLGTDYVKDAEALKSCDFMKTTPGFMKTTPGFMKTTPGPTAVSTMIKAYTVLVSFMVLLALLSK